MRKIIVTVAPVCHVGKPIPEGCKNPLTPEEITEDVLNCYRAGACQVHLHTRDLKGTPTFELDVFNLFQVSLKFCNINCNFLYTFKIFHFICSEQF